MTQVLANILISASIICLVGIGFSIIFVSHRFFNLSFAIIFTIGAYLTLLFHLTNGIPLIFAVALSIIISCIINIVLELLVFFPLKRKKVSANVLLITSLGIYIIMQNLISISFGDSIQNIQPGRRYNIFNIYEAKTTSIQILTIILCIIFMSFSIILFKKARIGKKIRAIASDLNLSRISGINIKNVIFNTVIIGSMFASFAGILFALDVNMTPTMGMNILMMGIVAMIIGGVGSIPGIALGSLFLAFAQNFGVWKISSQWQDAIAFGILLVFLIFRPQGFLGKKIKKATV